MNNVFDNLDGVFGRLNGTMDSLGRVVGSVNGIVSRGEETLRNADDLIDGVSNLWIVKRSIPKRDSVPFVAEDPW